MENIHFLIFYKEIETFSIMKRKAINNDNNYNSLLKIQKNLTISIIV